MIPQRFACMCQFIVAAGLEAEAVVTRMGARAGTPIEKHKSCDNDECDRCQLLHFTTDNAKY
jgi:hypothetical protein